jgi:hypothetical protein
VTTLAYVDDSGSFAFVFAGMEAYWAAIARNGRSGLPAAAKPAPRPGPECGTLAGARRHKQHGEHLCDRCEAAEASYARSSHRERLLRELAKYA